MTPAALCINIHRFLKTVESLKFPMTLSKLAFLACCDGRPKGTRSVCAMMGTTQAAASIALETLRDGGYLSREDKYGGLYGLTDSGRWLLNQFFAATRGHNRYDKTTKERGIRGAEEKRPDTGEVLPLPLSGEPEAHGPAPCQGQEP